MPKSPPTRRKKKEAEAPLTPTKRKARRQSSGRTWIHAALSVTTRFVLTLLVGPRTLEKAKELLGRVALCCQPGEALLLLMDNHLPYPNALLEVFGQIQYGRRRKRRGRRKLPRLKAPANLLVGVVRKVRALTGEVVGVQTEGLHGSVKAIKRRMRDLGIGQLIHTAHIERLNGTLRGQQSRLERRTRKFSRDVRRLEWSLALWRDLYNWTRTHGSLGQTPAMAEGLASHRWSVQQYLSYPVHVSSLQRDIWAEELQEKLTSALEGKKLK